MKPKMRFRVKVKAVRVIEADVTARDAEEAKREGFKWADYFYDEMAPSEEIEEVLEVVPLGQLRTKNGAGGEGA